MECDRCWQEVQQLELCVTALRFDPALVPIAPGPEVVSVFGVSGKFERAFGGHAPFAVTVATLYGFLWMMGLWTELGYAYDRFASLAWSLSAPVAVWATASVLVSLHAATNAVRSGRFDSLVRAAAVALVALGFLTVGLMELLPTERTILASIQTRTASGGYFKDAAFLFLPLLLLIVPPFHTVVALQRELKEGRYEQVLNLLTRTPHSIAPRGSWYLSPRVLTALLIVGGMLKIVGANYMLDALHPGPYSNVFSLASYISTALWLVIGGGCVAWYTASLNEVKRECLALKTLVGESGQQSH